MLAYRTVPGSAPLLPLPYDNLHPLQKSEICERASPHGAITERHKITFQNIFIHRSWLVEWTSYPHPKCWIPHNFQASPENSSVISWLHLKKKKKKKKTLLPFLNFALFSQNSHRLARICSEQCLEICITSTSFVGLPLYNVLLIVFLNCMSLWIKASAKWINVNVTGKEMQQMTLLVPHHADSESSSTRPGEHRETIVWTADVLNH